MWTTDALVSEAKPWRASVWRVVESQSKVSTMKLVDTLDEQKQLEAIIERSKPALPAACAGLHYLLSTPFRYRPYPHGSRFRRAGQAEGCLYVSDTPDTAIAETAFYSLLFFLEAEGMTLPSVPLERTAFSVRIDAHRAIDLTGPPLDRDASLWTDPTGYAPCQDLADRTRDAGIGALRYRSVRDPRHGMNAAILDPAAIASRQPEASQTWHLFVGRTAVQAFRELPSDAIEFTLQDWSGDPRLARHRPG